MVQCFFVQEEISAGYPYALKKKKWKSTSGSIPDESSTSCMNRKKKKKFTNNNLNALYTRHTQGFQNLFFSKQLVL